MNIAIIIQIHQEIYGKLKEIKLKVPANNTDLVINNSQSFKYTTALVGKTANHNDGKSSVKDAKIVVPLKHLSDNFGDH